MFQINQPRANLPFDLDKYGHLYKEVSIPAKTILLREGEIARQAYYIQKGCLRLSFNNNGRDITFQFFFEGQGVSSIESFRNGRPGLFSIESLEPCTLLVITKKNFEKMLAEVPGYKALIEESIYQRLEHYSALFLSHIRDTPQKRYQELLKEHPQLIQRIPQHYIASYLGISPVSLSRIRNKLGRSS
jgi:CRP-like cAMP-binding protein